VSYCSSVSTVHISDTLRVAHVVALHLENGDLVREDLAGTREALGLSGREVHLLDELESIERQRTAWDVASGAVGRRVMAETWPRHSQRAHAAEQRWIRRQRARYARGLAVGGPCARRDGTSIWAPDPVRQARHGRTRPREYLPGALRRLRASGLTWSEVLAIAAAMWPRWGLTAAAAAKALSSRPAVREVAARAQGESP
jgi:hypothetical protein